MPIVAVFERPNDEIAKYHKVSDVGGQPILDQPGRLHHRCDRTETGWTVVDLRRDDVSFAAFGELSGPVQLSPDDDALDAGSTGTGMILLDEHRTGRC